MRATPGSLFEIMLHCKKPQSQEMVQKKGIQIVLRNKKYVAWVNNLAEWLGNRLNMAKGQINDLEYHSTQKWNKNTETEYRKMLNAIED